MKNINLQAHRKSESRMFSGREYGLEIREKLKLDEKDKDNEIYYVQVSDDTLAINSSFFGGLFSESVINLGEENFREKYVFQNSAGEKIKDVINKDIEEGIYDALNS